MELKNETIKASYQILHKSRIKKTKATEQVAREEARQAKIEKTVLRKYTKKSTQELLQIAAKRSLQNTKLSRVRRKQAGFERDYELAAVVKKIYKYKCQFPGCNAKIPQLKLKRKQNYVEINHIIPLKQKGKDTIDNMIVVCPNHHKMMDYGILKELIVEPNKFKFVLNGRHFEIPRKKITISKSVVKAE